MVRISTLLSLLFVLFATQSVSAQADNYRAFEIDFPRLGYAIPGGEALSGGISLGFEPRFNIKDNLSAGLRVDFALFGAADDLEGVDVGAYGSYALMGDYYFGTETATRFFAGLGLGLFSGGDVSFDDGMGNTVEADAGSSFGVIPRVGVELGHLRVNLEYNAPLKDGYDGYFGITIAPTIGGGVK